MGNLFGDFAKGIGEVCGTVGRGVGDACNGIGSVCNTVVHGVGDACNGIAKGAEAVGNEIGKIDPFNRKKAEQAKKDYEKAYHDYEVALNHMQEGTEELYALRKKAIQIIWKVETHLSLLAHKPKEFDVSLQEISLEMEKFENKEEEISQALKKARMNEEAGVLSGAAGTAAGAAVAAMGPTVAMGIATTFGVASTDTAISALSGAAATNAALAWLGGGALAAGGGGMAAGNALIALAGPIGWTIAGVSTLTAVGFGIASSNKNQEYVNQCNEQQMMLEKAVRQIWLVRQDIKGLLQATERQMINVRDINDMLTGTDYLTFSDDEKYKAGYLVNSALSLAEMVNKELTVKDLDETEAEVQ